MASLPIAKLYKIFITPSLGPLLSSSVPRPSCFRRVLGCVVGLGAVAVAGGCGCFELGFMPVEWRLARRRIPDAIFRVAKTALCALS